MHKILVKILRVPTPEKKRNWETKYVLKLESSTCDSV